MDAEPLQTDEVNKALYEGKHCNLSHTSTGTHVRVSHREGDDHAPWDICYLRHDILDRDVLAKALALGFELSAWPSGTQPPVYQLSRHCFGIRAAAIKALQLARMLPGVPEDAWLYLNFDCDDSGEIPEPPKPWPPVA